MPEEGEPHEPRGEILDFEEIERLARLLCRLGIAQVRVTGGEPFLRRDLPALIGRLSVIPGLRDLSLTTNAVRLAPLAAALKAAGLNRINISLDSLRPERFYRITRGGELAKVLNGIEAALAAGLIPVKLNTVVMRGVNDDELTDLIRFAEGKGVTLRFLEVMPLGSVGPDNRAQFMPASEIRQRIETEYKLVPIPFEDGSTTQDYHIEGTSIRIGIISPVSERFCDTCNRLRLTARGRLQLCLAHEDGMDLKKPLREGSSDDELGAMILKAVHHKPAGNHFAEDPEPVYQIAMSKVGG
jgi:cyclic pyranopterin phosphate synthase